MDYTVTEYEQALAAYKKAGKAAKRLCKEQTAFVTVTARNPLLDLQQ